MYSCLALYPGSSPCRKAGKSLGTREEPGYEGGAWVRGRSLGTREEPGYEGGAWVGGRSLGTREEPG